VAPEERQTVIRALTDFFVPMTESQADRLLQVVGAHSTPSGWGIEPDAVKRLQMKRLLAEQSDDVLIEARELLPDHVESLLIAPPHLDPSPAAEAELTSDGPIFVVHGRARAALHEAVRVLERGTGRDVVVLHEQANAGRTILEKFEDHAAAAAFAVVLLTGDDEGGVRTSADTHPRGRQNVIFELGFFFGKLGRQRVAVLLEEGTEKPSDIDGLVYISLDQAGAWKQALARELETAGISVDRSRIP
jgi:predicted nucleotide-binding protein